MTSAAVSSSVMNRLPPMNTKSDATINTNTNMPFLGNTDEASLLSLDNRELRSSIRGAIVDHHKTQASTRDLKNCAKKKISLRLQHDGAFLSHTTPFSGACHLCRVSYYASVSSIHEENIISGAAPIHFIIIKWFCFAARGSAPQNRSPLSQTTQLNAYEPPVPNYCSECGATDMSLQIPPGDERHRATCSSCASRLVCRHYRTQADIASQASYRAS